ncbi:RTA1 like protein-domain-containing protein [Lophiotrema nucula]|uniref:RTA1 like protein-domain-containing protein n=1 Tax=Lophiotrema nucula TaxID=690887 RepID=A0A6A5ZRB4_9PLEO|nr:RTA1 like protein-domain-containing protein [Lophiotrema nucula]
MAVTPPRVYYHYTPSLPAAIVAVVVFFVLFSLHTFKLFKTRTWFCTPFVIGALFEIIGYAGRAYAHTHTDSKPVYIVQTLFILLAPILFAASIYMFLGRIIRSTGLNSLSIVRPTWLTKIFVGGDILCFLVQALGAIILTTSDTSDGVNRGKAIVLVGLVLQIIFFGFFVVTGLVFHMKARKKQASSRFDWQKYMNWLYAVSAIITARNIYRVVEYVQGVNGYLMTHEWSIYTFDALLMATVLGLVQMWYLGNDVANKDGHQDLEMIADHGREPYRQTGH